jgi:hypothetical protein
VKVNVRRAQRIYRARQDVLAGKFAKAVSQWRKRFPPPGEC